MLPLESPKRPAARPGRLTQALLRLLMRQALVVAAEPLGDRFRLITVEGAALKDVAWTAGQKIQIAMGSAFVTRTYTPIEWNASAGRACILAFAHGDGPGSNWVRGVQPGDTCDIFGPRASLDASRMTGKLAVFGDETSIGLAYALAHRDPSRPVTCYFEVGDVTNARRVVTQLGLGEASLFAREDDDAHWPAMAAAIPALVADGASFALTGKAATVQRLRQILKRHDVPAAGIVTKAYWAPGKTGLD